MLSYIQSYPTGPNKKYLVIKTQRSCDHMFRAVPTGCCLPLSFLVMEPFRIANLIRIMLGKSDNLFRTSDQYKFLTARTAIDGNSKSHLTACWESSFTVLNSSCAGVLIDE